MFLEAAAKVLYCSLNRQDTATEHEHCTQWQHIKREIIKMNIFNKDVVNHCFVAALLTATKL